MYRSIPRHSCMAVESGLVLGSSGAFGTTAYGCSTRCINVGISESRVQVSFEEAVKFRQL